MDIVQGEVGSGGSDWGMHWCHLGLDLTRLRFPNRLRDQAIGTEKKEKVDLYDKQSP